MKGLLQYLRLERAPGAIPELDGLRGLAILLVLFRHAALAQGFRVKYEPLLGFPVGDPMIWCLNGWSGVDLFFVLSGFLITQVFQRQAVGEPTAGHWRRYLQRRILRIVPAYYAVLLLVAFEAVPFFDIKLHDWGWRLFYHLAFLQDLLGSNFVGAFWSLGVEEKFYLLALFILPSLVSLPLRPQLASALVLVLLPTLCRAAGFLLDQPPTDYHSYFANFRSPFYMCWDGIFTGVLVACLYQASSSLTDHRYAKWLSYAACTLLMVLLGGSILQAELNFTTVVFTTSLLNFSFGALMLGLLLHRRTLLAQLMRSPILFFFCKLSYSLYLVHMLFMKPVRYALWRWINSGASRPFEFTPGFFLAYLALYLSLSTLAALVLHYTVEKPFLLLRPPQVHENPGNGEP